MKIPDDNDSDKEEFEKFQRRVNMLLKILAHELGLEEKEKIKDLEVIL